MFITDVLGMAHTACVVVLLLWFVGPSQEPDINVGLSTFIIWTTICVCTSSINRTLKKDK